MSDAGSRGLRALAGTATAPPATDDEQIPVAGTAILLRDAPGGMEVLLMLRPERGSFAGAWVFPGGRIEPIDQTGDGDETADARRAAARETAEEVGLVVDEAALVPVSCWEPPRGIPKRIRTWFFLGRADAGELSTSAAEVVDAVWLRPADALARHARGEGTLYPPTWVTLHALSGSAGVDEAIDTARTSPPGLFRTVIRHDGADAVFVWEPDVAHDPDADLNAPGARHRLITGALPWRYLRADVR